MEANNVEDIDENKHLFVSIEKINTTLTNILKPVLQTVSNEKSSI